jgi:ABC-type branched-subunit amino acid transport system ATPase component
MGLVPRTVGTLRPGDQDLQRVRARDMVRHGIGYVPEGRHVFSGLSVEKKLLLGAYARPWNDETKGALAETCLVMENGSVAMTDPSRELSHAGRVRQIYLGL